MSPIYSIQYSSTTWVLAYAHAYTRFCGSFWKSVSYSSYTVWPAWTGCKLVCMQVYHVTDIEAETSLSLVQARKSFVSANKASIEPELMEQIHTACEQVRLMTHQWWETRMTVRKPCSINEMFADTSTQARPDGELNACWISCCHFRHLCVCAGTYMDLYVSRLSWLYCSDDAEDETSDPQSDPCNPGKLGGGTQKIQLSSMSSSKYNVDEMTSGLLPPTIQPALHDDVYVCLDSVFL